jgi:AmmeMemoRadiSam system protein B
VSVRQPCVAGQFYEADPARCREDLQRCLDEAAQSEAPAVKGAVQGGVVPHAGWLFSGPTAAKVFRAIAASRTPDTIVLLGADHKGTAPRPTSYHKGSWRTPLGEVAVDEKLAGKVSDEMGDDVLCDPQAHGREHSLEVQVPFIQHLFPNAKILPITVPPDENAHRFGERLGEALHDDADRIVIVGSSDLTHYGPNYGFMPKGLGEDALRWVKDVNDKAVIELALGMKADRIVPQTVHDSSACGAGAIAATAACCWALGVKSGTLLGYTTSHDVMPERRMSSFVGYAAIAYGRE